MTSEETILIPCCSTVHGELVQAALDASLVRARVVAGSTAESVRAGLGCVNNDACYETLASVGSLLGAVDELRGEPCRIVVPRTCAECRSMDTAAFAARSLRSARGIDVPIFDATELLRTASNDDCGQRIQQRIGLALWTGDIVMMSRCMLRPGASAAASERYRAFEARWMRNARRVVEANDLGEFERFCEQTIMEAFETAGDELAAVPEVALVGSAPVLFDEHMNAGAVSELESEGCRVNLPKLSGYVRWETASVSDSTVLGLQLGKLGSIVRGLDLPVSKLETRMRLRATVTGVVPESLRYGDGWRIAARIAYQAEQGVRNFVYVSTFGCLSGHIMGKGVLRWTRGLAPGIHVSAIEYDPGTSAVNQSNRIKLIASIAKSSLTAEGRHE